VLVGGGWAFLGGGWLLLGGGGWAFLGGGGWLFRGGSGGGEEPRMEDCIMQILAEISLSFY
jgi:hypothetical protein